MASLRRILKVKTKSIPLSLNDEVHEPGMLFAILNFSASRKAHGCGPETKLAIGTKRVPCEYGLTHLISNLESKSSEAHHQRHQRSCMVGEQDSESSCATSWLFDLSFLFIC